MRMIARHAGISVGGLYLYFDNKEQLYLTIMGERMAEVEKKTDEMLKSVEDPKEALRNFISTSLHHARENKAALLLQRSELGLTFAREMKIEFFRKRIASIEKIIQDGIDRGVFEACNAGEAARVIFSAIRGFFVSVMLEEDILFDPDECSNFVLSGLLKRPHAY
jgi:AcrR family transcriptional regulator